MSIGPLMIDLAGLALSAADKAVLRHEMLGGVVLFGRNYQDPAQLRALVQSIHELRTPPLLIAVDQEGGRVQRFADGFTRLPPARSLGRRWDLDHRDALDLARSAGWLMASEVLAVGVDFSFAPCVDLDYGVSEIIGDRAIHADPDVVCALSVAYVIGMREAGMAAVAKHFPGHGAVVSDSHVAVPLDRRRLSDMEADLRPYRVLIDNQLPALMAGHVVFPEVDSKPASLSRRWITGVLRNELHFHGCVFTDDLSMAGAARFGSPSETTRQALAAGCDVVLICNDRDAVHEVLNSFDAYVPEPASSARVVRMRARHGMPDQLAHSDRWREAVAKVQALSAPPQFTLTEGRA